MGLDIVSLTGKMFTESDQAQANDVSHWHGNLSSMTSIARAAIILLRDNVPLLVVERVRHTAIITASDDHRHQFAPTKARRPFASPVLAFAVDSLLHFLQESRELRAPVAPTCSDFLCLWLDLPSLNLKRPERTANKTKDL